MQMVDGLVGIRAVVHHAAVSALGYTLTRRDARGGQGHLSQDTVMLRISQREVGDVLPRDHQDVNRGRRIDVAKGHDILILVDNVGGNLAHNNAAKETIDHVSV